MRINPSDFHNMHFMIDGHFMQEWLKLQYMIESIQPTCNYSHLNNELFSSSSSSVECF